MLLRVPDLAFMLAETVSVEALWLDPPRSEVGLKVAVTPRGRLLVESETEALYPLDGVRVIVALVVPPLRTVIEFGALSEKPDAGALGADPVGANAAVPLGVPSPVGPS